MKWRELVVVVGREWMERRDTERSAYAIGSRIDVHSK